MKFDEWARNSRNFNKKEQPEYYEDTHDNNGKYFNGRDLPEYSQADIDAQRSSLPPQGQYDRRQSGMSGRQQNLPPMPEYVSPRDGGMPLPQNNTFAAPRNYHNVVVYEPRSPEDVQTLIDYLKRREPAIINLDNVDAEVAQRVLDFVSGAMYALNGSVHRIAGNIFLLSPEGVEITVPYEL